MAELITTSLYNDANLQEYYRLEDLTGKNSNTLTNTNTVAFNAAKFGLGGDGGASNSNKTLSVTNRLGYTGGSYSIAFWVKLDAEIASSEWVFTGITDNTTSKSSIEVHYEYNGGTQRITFHRIKHGVADTTFSSNITLGTSTFHHIAWTYDGTTLTGYIDNVNVGTLTSNGNGSTSVSDIFAILADRNNTLNASAIVDDVGLFNRVLTTGEINTLYTPSAVATTNLNYTFIM